MDISLICPCYKSEKYLLEAVNSFLKQDFDGESELIIVVDPPLDATKALLSSIEDPRVKVIYNEERQGICSSRLQGIRASTGKYIGFLDADDYLDPSFCREMCSHLKDHDVVDCNFYVINKNGKEFIYPFKGFSASYTGTKMAKKLLEDTKVRGFLWSKAYKREIIISALDEVRIPNAHMFEDMPLNFAAIAKCEKAYVTSKALYHYRKSTGETLTNAKRPDRAKQHIEVFAIMRHYADLSGDKRLINAVAGNLLRMKMSLWYDFSLSKKDGLSKEDAKTLKKQLKYLKAKPTMPIEGMAWEEIIHKCFKD